MIRVYTGPECPRCTLVKRYLRLYGVPFDEVAAEDHREQLVAYGYRTIPVVRLREKSHAGFNPMALQEYINELD